MSEHSSSSGPSNGHAGGGSPGHGCPFHAGAADGPVLAGEGGTDYERYMRTDELLELQKPTEELVHHDELLFQTVHQSFELWCKLVLHELDQVERLIAEDRLVEATPLVARCSAAIRVNTDALHVLETMTPWDFHVIRRALGQGSGSESPGFRGVLARAPTFWPSVEALVERRGTTLLAVYEKQDDQELLRFLEALTDLDMFFHIWRLNHLAMIKRVIGRDVKSLKGYAIHALESDVQMVLWPALWSVRNELTTRAGTSPD
ncbi:MAG: tryptophan 2,3-dioxygenase family protein [Thermoplasmatota archaeon]